MILQLNLMLDPSFYIWKYLHNLRYIKCLEYMKSLIYNFKMLKL